jgi:organic hydroperoxide reductase OsmC/OhrA
MKGERVKYEYNTHLEWTSEKRGILRCKGKPDIKVACPPEFGGHPGFWSPEDLFVGSVEVCMLTTFLWFVNKENVTLKSYRSKTSGSVELVSGVFRFSSITVTMNIGISHENDRNIIEKILKKVKRACLVSNSIQSEVNIESIITVG